MKDNILVLDTETTSKNPHEAELLGISTYTKGQANYTVEPKVSWTNEDMLVGHNIKYDIIVCRRAGVKLPKAYADTMLLYYILHIERPRKLEKMMKDVLGIEKEDLLQVYNRCTGKSRKNLPDKWYEEVPSSQLIKYAMEDAEATKRLYDHLMVELELQPPLKDWFFNVEMRILNILTEMELLGVRVDRSRLEGVGKHFEERKEFLLERLYMLAGVKINLNSPKQLQELLYDIFKLPKGRKTKTGYSTDTDTLAKLADKHAFPRLLLEYREIEKLLSTYIAPILLKLDSDNRLHTTYNQCLTRTRRFSSEDPNLQNIPARSDVGRLVRECFVPSPGKKFLICDYDQMELRILAHASSDKVMIEAFKNGLDIHQITADACGIERRFAKTINFSIVYGTTEFGLSKNLGCSRVEAKEFINKWLKKYEGVCAYMSDQRGLAVSNSGFVTSYPGRLPLYVGDVTSNDKFEFEECMRRAINAPIQCGSQDILKVAKVRIEEELHKRAVLMVHDELVFDLVPNEETFSRIINIMETAWELKVPLKVTHKVADYWEK